MKFLSSWQAPTTSTVRVESSAMDSRRFWKREEGLAVDEEVEMEEEGCWVSDLLQERDTHKESIRSGLKKRESRNVAGLEGCKAEDSEIFGGKFRVK
ncbi:hypothetical protein Q3G72_010870 [Acer saccharum]|nr:hypothetical protein Q3G72_010870 [Acer saccharum]